MHLMIFMAMACLLGKAFWSIGIAGQPKILSPARPWRRRVYF